MEYYLIGEVAKKLGINKETIRYYEKINLIKYDLTRENNYHYYSENTLYIIKFIIEIKKYAFTLNEIKSVILLMTNGLKKNEIDFVLKLLNKKMEYLDSAIRKMTNITLIIKNLINDINNQNIKECNNEECGINEIKEILDFIKDNKPK